jgi:hypothetical protein
MKGMWTDLMATVNADQKTQADEASLAMVSFTSVALLKMSYHEMLLVMRPFTRRSQWVPFPSFVETVFTSRF